LYIALSAHQYIACAQADAAVSLFMLHWKWLALHGSVCSSHVADGPSLPSRGICFRPWCAAWPLTRCVADRDRSSARAGAGPRLVLVCYSVGEAFACRSGRPELVATNEWSRLAASHQAAGRQAGPCKKWDHDAARKAFFFLFGWT